MERKSEVFSLEDIIEKNKIILIDSGIGRVGHNLVAELYYCRQSLSIDNIDMKKYISGISELISLIFENENVFTIPEVKKELKKYQNLINNQVNYHEKNISSRRFKKGKTATRNYGRTDKYNKISKKELSDLDDLRIYSNKLFELVKILDKITIEVKDKNMLAELEDLVKNIELKSDYGYRYGTDEYKSRSPLKLNTDEKIIMTAYELSVKDDVAIVSNDSDLYRMITFCFQRCFFSTDKRKNIRLYSDFENRGYKLVYETSDINNHKTSNITKKEIKKTIAS